MVENKDKQKLAEDRTDWAEDRTVLANERTFASWMGTGLGSIGIAIALQAVFGAFEPTWLAKTVATLFVGIAIVIFVAALRNSKSMIARLESHTAEPVSRSGIQLIASLMIAASVATAIILWLL